MANDVRVRFGTDGWLCTNYEPDLGEQPITGQFVKQGCEKTTPEGLVFIESHLFRKAGQTEIDPITGQVVRGLFESSARLEIRERSVARDASGRPL